MPNTLQSRESVAADTPPYAHAVLEGGAEIVAKPGESEAWKPIGERMTVRHVRNLDPGHFQGLGRS